MSQARGLLDRGDILELLELVAAEATRRDVHIEMFLVGGAAMALAYSTTRATKDLDGVFEPKMVVGDIAASVAATAGFDLPSDWLNDGVKGLLPGDDQNATVMFDNRDRRCGSLRRDTCSS